MIDLLAKQPTVHAFHGHVAQRIVFVATRLRATLRRARPGTPLTHHTPCTARAPPRTMTCAV